MIINIEVPTHCAPAAVIGRQLGGGQKLKVGLTAWLARHDRIADVILLPSVTKTE